MALLPIRTLVDCGCETRVYGDHSGVEIDYCDLHAAAYLMQKALEQAKDLPALYSRIDEGDSVYHRDLVARVQRIHAQVREALKASRGESA
jgi:hypothetical protein